MASFKLFLPILQKIEGGYQNLSEDKGNFNSLGQLVGTNHGISARFYEGIIRRPPTVADMKAISKAKAEILYKKYFWDAVLADKISNQTVANIIVDHGVNGGESTIAKIVQTILRDYFGKNIKVDGDIGSVTVAALNTVNQELLFQKIKLGRANYYKSLNSSFVSAWLDRVKNFSFSKNDLPSGQVA